MQIKFKSFFREAIIKKIIKSMESFIVLKNVYFNQIGVWNVIWVYSTDCQKEMYAKTQAGVLGQESTLLRCT